MRLRFMLAAAALLSSMLAMPRSGAAQKGGEDVTTTFNLDAKFSNGGAITGQLFFDTATDTFTRDELTASGFGSGANGTFTNISSQGIDGGVDYVLDINGPSLLELSLPVANPAEYSGAICSLAADCSAGSTNYEGIFTTSGTLEAAVVPTPEPSGFLLLATGLLGIGALIRRKSGANFCGVLHRTN
jgi:hypothetical protein